MSRRVALAVLIAMTVIAAPARATDWPTKQVTIYVTNIKNNTTVWKARAEFFTGDFPASTLVEVSALAAPEILVEIEAIAHIGKGKR